MSSDRITQISIEGLRVIDKLTLKLDGLTVLIGENGVGKSTILEALELLRKAAGPADFISDVITKGHGGLENLLRRGAEHLSLSVRVEGAGPSIGYELRIGLVDRATRILQESFLNETGQVDVLRKLDEVYLIDPETAQKSRWHAADPGRLILASSGPATPEPVQRLTRALSQIECHFPFETRPLWQQKELDTRVGPRWPSVLEKVSSLARYGVNLPNCYQQLRNQGDEVWSRIQERARLGLGEDFRDFQMPAYGRGQIELTLIYGTSPDHPQPVEYCSEGQLSYLAFLALSELHDNRSVLAVDEPEEHLHPGLLALVVGLLEETSHVAPVVLATHSDRLLDVLSDPAASVVLCELDEKRALQMRRPQPEKLKAWQEDYRGLGSIRADGYLSHVFEEPGT